MNAYRLRYSVCIEMMFAECDFYDRPAASARAGLPDLEIWRWAEHDMPRLRDALAASGARIAMTNVASARIPGITEQLWLGILSAKSDSATLDAAEETAALCDELGCKRVLMLAGDRDDAMSDTAQRDRLIRMLDKLGGVFAPHGIALMFEPLNTYTRPLAFVSRAADGFDIIRQVNRPNVRLLYDTFHQQQMEGHLVRSLTENMPLIGHIHIVDVPDRLPPGQGEINFQTILKTIEASGYDGFCGLEYIPRGNTPETLDFLI